MAYGQSVSPLRAARMRQEVLDVGRRGQWDETMRRMRSLGGGRGAPWEPGQEFKAARRGYKELLGAPRVRDVRGVGDLNVAEAAALIGEEEMIGTEMADIEEQMRNEMARAGGGGSEWTEMRRELLEGGMGAKIKARRGALTTAQGSREAAKLRRQQGIIAGGAGMTTLAGQRQGMQRFGAQNTLQRLQMLQDMMSGGAPSGVMGPSPTAMYAQPLGRGWSPETMATELRNQYIWPTQFGYGFR